MYNVRELSKKAIVLLLSFVLIVSLIPTLAFPAFGATSDNVVTDPGTANSWEQMLGTSADGARYAGRVWADKSVYKDGDTAVLKSGNEAGSSFKVNLEDDEYFQVIFSALGTSMSSTETVTSGGKLDVVMVIDNSQSMSNTSGGTTRLQKVIEASNKLLGQLSEVKDLRLGIVTYGKDSSTVLPLAKYDDGVVLSVNNYSWSNYGSSSGGKITAKNKNGVTLGSSSSGYQTATNLQAGFDLGTDLLNNATNIAGRTPVMIVLTDGNADTAVNTNWYNPSAGKYQTPASNSVSKSSALSTLLSAAYNKAEVEDKYGKKPIIYGVGVDLSDGGEGLAIINPGHATYGFNSGNKNKDITDAYANYVSWASGNTVSYRENNQTWTFDHNLPGNVTTADVIANINYVDTYYNAAAATLGDSFDQIYEELVSGAFNPISTTTNTAGGTGVDETPLIYVDTIGKHMEVKEIEAITLFGHSYGVTKNADGTYQVQAGTGKNPTTNEDWNTTKDIRITLEDKTSGLQELKIEINQEILPITLEQIDAETVGGVTNATLTELQQNPLRVYYTVGVDSDVLLPNGEIDITKVQDSIDKNGNLVLYSNAYDTNDVTNAVNTHMGFRPAENNRYYYNQTNHGIFTDIKHTDGTSVKPSEWNNAEYGMVWDPSKYSLEWMTYADYKAKGDNDQAYTYVTYYHPAAGNAGARATAEKITYVINTEWKYLKESVAFYNAKTGKYANVVNGQIVESDSGVAVEAADLAVIENYSTSAELYAVLGVGSKRSSRFHNMEREKDPNATNTAVLSYNPDYTYNTAHDPNNHHGNDVVVWLGNNGKVTLTPETGIALTKNVTKNIGGANDTYALTVTHADVNKTLTPVVKDDRGNEVAFEYKNNTIKVDVKAGQTVYITGIPAGTECTIGEEIPTGAEYYVADKTEKVVVPTVLEVKNNQNTKQFAEAYVTNAPYEYGNLFITKEITSNHAIPDAVLAEEFNVTVDVDDTLEGKTYKVKKTGVNGTEDVKVTNGKLNLTIKDRQTIEVLDLPHGTNVTVTENLTTEEGKIYTVTYKSRNATGEPQDNDGKAVVTSGANATVVIKNDYAPKATNVNLNINGTKNFTAELGATLSGGTFKYKVQQWNGSSWVDIAGKTAETAYAANESGTKLFTIENVLAGISYSKVGNYAYQVVEVKGNYANVTYDRTLYTFNVTVTDNGGQLAAAVTDMNNNPITDGSYEVVFNNTYNTAPLSIDITKKVNNLSGDDAVSKAGFEFKAVATNANWVPKTGTGASELKVYSDAAGEARVTATYTAEGTYYYILSETNGNQAGWSYSEAEYRVAVVVTKYATGNLEAVMTITKNMPNGAAADADEVAIVDANDKTKGSVVFENTYNPEDAVVDLETNHAVRKTLSGKLLVDGMFNFAIYENGDRTNAVLTGTNTQDGNVVFDKALSFSSVGKYEYDIVELVPDGATLDAETGRYVLNGMSYDPVVYDLVVEVTNNQETGKLEAAWYFEDAVEKVVTFVNYYEVKETSLAIAGVKDLIGRSLGAGEFEFELYEGSNPAADARPIQTVANRGDGQFSFNEIIYTEAGTYIYTVKEKVGNVPGVKYTGAQEPVTVTVTVINNNGQLEATRDKQWYDVKFENLYEPTAAKVIFEGSKELVGGTFGVGTFNFKLYETDHTFDIESTQVVGFYSTGNDADGNFTFERTLDKTGTYYFAIVEDASNPMEGIVYDGQQHNFVVNVSDVGDGKYRVEVKNVTDDEVIKGELKSNGDDKHYEAKAGLSFTNATFEEAAKKEVAKEADTNIKIDGKKVEVGEVLTYFITYTNYTGEDVVVDIMDTIPAYTTYVEGSASHEGTFAGEHLSWILNVPKGESVTVSFSVKVNEYDAIIANTALIVDGKNVYSTNEVKNYTDKKLAEEIPPIEVPTTKLPASKLPETPDTGDYNNIMLWTALAALAATGFVGLISKKKEEE